MASATVFNPATGQRKQVTVGDPNAFAGGFQLETSTNNLQTAKASPTISAPKPPTSALGATYNPQSAGIAVPPVPSNVSGITAASPTQNIKPPTNTLPTQYQAPKTTTPVPKTTTGAIGTTSPTSTVKAPTGPVARNLAAEQVFVKSWGGKGGRLPTAAEINQGVYGTATPNFTTAQGAAATSAPQGSLTGGFIPTQTSQAQNQAGTTQQLNTLGQGLLTGGSPLGGIVGGLVSRSAAPSTDYTTTTGNLQGAASQLAGLAGAPSPDYTRQLATANQYNQQLSDLRQQEAQALANNALNPIPLEFQQGRAQVLASQYGQREQALGSAFQGAASLVPATTGQQAAQQQGLAAAGGLLGTALGAANTQQQLQQQGLGTAANALQPQLGAYGQAQYSPLGGLIGGGTGAGVSPTDPFYQTMQTYAQQLATGQSAAIPSSVSGNPVLQAQLLNMARAINPNFNYNTALGTGAAQQQTAQIGGSGFVQANQQVYNNALQTVASLMTKNNNVKSFGDQVIQNMQTYGINPTELQWGNKTLNQILTQFSAPQYAQFNTNIQGLQARVSDLLQTGEIPSAATYGASQIVNGNINLAAMQSTLNQLTSEGDALVQNAQSTAQQAYNNMTGGAAGSGGTGGALDWNTILNWGG